MTLSLLQKGLTNDLVMLFLPSVLDGLRAKILRALGPVPIVIITETAKGAETLPQILQFAAMSTGREPISLACLGGFSAGCQRVRALWLAGADARAYLLVDGAHASNPPEEWQIGYLRALVARARAGETTLVLSHTYIVTEPRFLSTVAFARLATGWELPKPAPGGYSTRYEGNLTVYSVHSGPSDAAAHSAQANVWLPILLDGHVRPMLQPGYEPGTIPMPWGRVPERVCTVAGWMDIEGEYVPRVVTRENGNAAMEALKAQAVAARTFVLRAMRDNPALGTASTPIPNAETFQTFAAAAMPACVAATRATAWQVATYQNELILGSYVAGARWSEDGVPVPGTDPKGTERWVTYNEGRVGDAVEPTKLAPEQKGNRGCMSQNGADWLARRGHGYVEILRCFYGADLEVVDLRGEAVPGSGQGTPGPGPPEGGGRRGGGGGRSAGGGADAGAAVFLLTGAAAYFWSRRWS